MKKQEKGITLIALIITIVVLLILAVVVIGAVNDSDIIGQAQDAVTRYNTAKGTEENRIGEYENLLDEYANKDKIKYYIYDNYLIQKVDLIANTITTVNLSEYDVDNNKISSIDTVSESVEINLLDDTTKTIEIGSLKIAVELEGNIIENAVYIQGDKIYGQSENANIYVAYTQITDAEQIADVEEAIENAQ